MGYIDKIFPDDIVLLILGEPTGKSNFLDAVYDLKGVTDRSGWPTYASFPCIMSTRVQDHDRLVLVKATRFDNDGLNLVCNWLQTIYRAGIRLSGIVYVHSIASKAPSPMIHSLGNICGVSALKKVMLVVTECDVVEGQTDKRRWSALLGDWNELIKRGVTVQRLDNSTSSMRTILDYFINGEKDRYPLLLQEEMVDRKMEFSETTIGRFATKFPNVETSDIDDKWRIMESFAALRAIHNSKDRYDPPKCHPDTRVEIKERLMTWILGENITDVPIFWLYGAAGIGKSAIAQTVAEICDQKRLLLASFFFSRTDTTRNTVNPLVATIAYQIGNAIPQTQELILNAIKKNEKIFAESVATQLMEMVIQPLSEFAEADIGAIDFPRLMIIDGLDECFDLDRQSQIVLDFAKALRSITRPFLHLLVVSRPEKHIEDTFSQIPASMLIHLQLDELCVPDTDIRVFLQDQFSSIKNKNSSIPSGWPSPATINRLVGRAGGRFVYASTMTKYISSDSNPIACLDSILASKTPDNRGTEFAELDSLYLHILSSIDDPQMTKIILGVVLFVNPDYDLFGSLSSSQISAAQTLTGVKSLLGPRVSNVEACLAKLYPMVTYCEQGNIFIPHATVAEFLNSPARSKSFHIEKSFVLTFLTRCCFDNIKNGSADDDSDAIRFSYGRLPQLCRNIAVTPELEKDLKEFSLSQAFQWSRANADRIGGTLRRKSLFPWWYVTKFIVVLRQLEIVDVYLHQLSAFDQLVHANLGCHPSVSDVHLLVALAGAPHVASNLTQTRVTNFLTQLHVGEANFTSDGPSERLGILSMYSENTSDVDCFRVGYRWDQDIVMDVYHQFLIDFFIDRSRSGLNCLSAGAYTSVSIKVLQLASRILSHTSGTSIDGPDCDAIRVAMLFLPYLLRKSLNSMTILELLPRRFNEQTFNPDDQCLIEGANRAITQYKKKTRWWKLIGLLKEKYSILPSRKLPITATSSN